MTEQNQKTLLDIAETLERRVSSTRVDVDALAAQIRRIASEETVVTRPRTHSGIWVDGVEL